MILIVLAALLPLALLSIVQGMAAWRDAETLIKNQLAAKASAVAEGERDPFIIARYTLLLASRDPAVRDMTDGCDRALAAGQVIATGVINSARSDAQGYVRCSVTPFNSGQRNDQTKWWKAGIRETGFSMSDPIMGSISKKMILIMMLPLKTADDRQNGAVTAAISLDALRNSLDSRRRDNPGTYIDIVTAQGVPLFTSNDRNAPDARRALRDQAKLVQPDGTEWTYATAPLYGPNLIVVYAEPTRNLMALARGQVRQGFVFPLVAMLLASLAIWLGTHRLVVRWLARLGTLTERFASGDYQGDRSMFVKAPYEIGRLSDTLHEMGQTIAARNAELNQALQTQFELTREINHRVKNNLQIVNSLLTLQADRVVEPTAREVLTQAKARIAALGLIHRLLYQQEGEASAVRVNMRKLLDELCPQMRAVNLGRATVELDCESDDVSISVDQSVPLTLLIVESVTNAICHAYGPGTRGTITIRFRAEDGRGILVIVDQGRGFDVSAARGNMGMELIHAFAVQLNGDLDLQSDTSGTRVRLSFSM